MSETRVIDSGADANARGRRRHLPDHDVGRGACNIREVVVFGEPVTVVAEPVGKARQIERIMQCRRARRGRSDRRQIENGKRNHPTSLP